jgi:cytochrome c peroxidase
MYIRLLVYLLLLLLVVTSVQGLDVKSSPSREQKTELGRALFFDKRLSEDGTVSCATCHDPASAFASGDAVAMGVREQKGTRNAPTLLNSVFSKSYFWDGRVTTLEEQAKQPLLNDNEMGMRNETALVERVSAIEEYQQDFARVFPQAGITVETIANAIAAFERTLVSDNSPFDRFISGDRSAISAAQKRGWELFKGKANCIECHSFSRASPFFTDFNFYNTGITANDTAFAQLRDLATQFAAGGQDSASRFAHTRGYAELGRYLVTKQLKDVGAFKTPSLRDIELTRPYMHNGSIKTLLDVVRFYNKGGEQNSNLDKKLRPLNLTEEELSELVEFMRALTSDAVLRQVQSSKPQNRNPVLPS